VRGLIVLVAVLLVATACTVSPATTTATTVTSSTTTVTTTTPACGPGQEFSQDGELLDVDQQGGDAARISGLNGERDSNCERFVIGLTTAAGAPATSVGTVRAVFLRDLGVVRVYLPDVTDTSITDGVFELPLVDRSYVVRAEDGSLYVDAHLGGASLARAVVAESPARIIVELEPGGPDLPELAPHSDLIVVLTPRGGKAGYPLVVSGYARTFEANVVVRLVKAGSVVTQSITTATDYLTAWGQFSTTLESGPQGSVDVVVGDDGDQEVTIGLVVN
jgi:hypothetical protein